MKFIISIMLVLLTSSFAAARVAKPSGGTDCRPRLAALLNSAAAVANATPTPACRNPILNGKKAKGRGGKGCPEEEADLLKAKIKGIAWAAYGVCGTCDSTKKNGKSQKDKCYGAVSESFLTKKGVNGLKKYLQTIDFNESEEEGIIHFGEESVPYTPREEEIFTEA